MMKKLPSLIPVYLLVLALLGCQTVSPVAIQPPTGIPGGTSPVTEPTRPAEPVLGTLGSVAISQSGKSPDYTAKLNTPVMNGSSDPHVVTFNKAISQVVQQQLDGFKKSLASVTPVPSSPGSSLDVEYTLISESSHIISLQLKMDQYMAGAAHPLQTSLSYNYDLAKDRTITLDELFTPGSKYLQAISDYAKATLSKTAVGPALFMDGFAPTADNYRNWNISPQGLMITFDEYQVAPYAAGPQQVLVPYDLLKGMIDPQGPLAEYTHP